MFSAVANRINTLNIQIGEFAIDAQVFRYGYAALNIQLDKKGTRLKFIDTPSCYGGKGLEGYIIGASESNLDFSKTGFNSDDWRSCFYGNTVTTVDELVAIVIDIIAKITVN